MILANYLRLGRDVILLLCVLLFGSQAHSQENQCSSVSDIVWSFNDKELGRMLSNASLPDNSMLSTDTKVARVAARIKMNISRKGHFEEAFKGTQAETPEDLAELIVNAADCTGNDFSMFTGLLHVESTYCLSRTNKAGSGASGCGQFTSAPIKVFKRHLMLPDRDANGSPLLKEGMETLVKRCYEDRPEKVEEFMELFSQSRREIQGFFRGGHDFEMDLIASAIYLKFYYAKAGFYYNPHTSTSGALTRYGTEPGYGNKVNKAANQVSLSCYEDDYYLNLIQETSCEVSEDPAACHLTTPTFEI